MTKKEYCVNHESIAYYSGLNGLEIKGIEHGIEGYSLYCYDDPRREIALTAGAAPENVVLWEFDGWTQTPRYKGGE